MPATFWALQYTSWDIRTYNQNKSCADLTHLLQRMTQDKISPTALIEVISRRQVMGITNNIKWGLLFDPIPDSLNEH